MKKKCVYYHSHGLDLYKDLRIVKLMNRPGFARDYLVYDVLLTLSLKDCGIIPHETADDEEGLFLLIRTCASSITPEDVKAALEDLEVVGLIKWTAPGLAVMTYPDLCSGQSEDRKADARRRFAARCAGEEPAAKPEEPADDYNTADEMELPDGTVLKAIICRGGEEWLPTQTQFDKIAGKYGEPAACEGLRGLNRNAIKSPTKRYNRENMGDAFERFSASAAEKSKPAPKPVMQKKPPIPSIDFFDDDEEAAV